PTPPPPNNLTHHTLTNSPLTLQQVTLCIPHTSTILIQDLSLTIAPDQSLLIVGESSVGKSSLLRGIAGLWRTGSGTILSPPVQNLLFLPQRPYMVLGSLRQQLSYPSPFSHSDQPLIQVLEQVQLAYLLDRWGGLAASPEWSTVLSLGEQQRLAFARLLLAQPQYALLDEATSALDEASEASLYALLQATSIAFISVGHRPTLLPYHQQVLHLKGDRTWMLSDSHDFGF
ncbi:MAG: ATP-binding cassette domain-containing protein, partial [Cyanobacteria bacterium CRU_2_1]|nr:ATP-binding cassette domain-containing protein [Cyanobacteria bacterium CRU_2_1]